MRKPSIFFLSVLIVLFLGACGATTTTTTTTTTSTTTTSTPTTSTTTSQAVLVPETPANVGYQDRVVTWNAVMGATSYTVKIDDVEYPSVESPYTIPGNLLGPLVVSVKAVNEAGSSSYSSPLNVTARLRLATPANLVQNRDTLSWQAVANAAGYVVTIGGAEYVTTDPWFVHAETSIKQATVIAVPGLSTYYDPSLPSSPINVVPLLPSPTGIAMVDGLLTWNEVEGASGYLIVFDETAVQVWATTLDVRYEYVGEETVTIIATSASADRLDSLGAVATVVFPVQIMPTPTNPRVEGNAFAWNEVMYASAYDVYVNGEFYQTTTITGLVIPSEILEAPGTTLQVLARSELHDSSPLTDPIAALVSPIGSEAELRAMGSTGSYYLTNDIVLTAPWTPLDFSGTFNGSNFTISGIQIASSGSNVGFFAVLNKAVVHSVTLNGTIQATTTQLEANVGGLAGMASDSWIVNVHIQIAITATSQNGVGRLGGVIGRTEGSTIQLATYSGLIDATHYVVGGLIGAAMNPMQASYVLQSKAQGSIHVAGGEQSVVGGFIGMMLDNMLLIKESYADMTVSGPNTVGGFVGYLGSGRIEDSYAKGSVAANNTAIVHLGGFIGRTEGYNAQVIRCIAIVSIGAVTGTDVYRGAFVGKTPGGTYATIYQNDHYDSAVASLDRIGNPTTGRGDGIAGLTPTQLQTLPQGYSNQVWNFTGSSPKLVWEG
jgi:hypothetical protein